MQIILEGVVGSVAYGLNTPESDIDLRGIWLAPTRDILSLNWTRDKETIDKNNPDVTWHEIAKFMRLALQGNPNILELLYLDEYTILTPIGQLLIEHRDKFLSNRIRTTYGGYAMSQLKRAQNRPDGSFSADTRKRTTKHVRHIFRLIQQGQELLENGKLTVKVPNPAEIIAVGEMNLDDVAVKFNEAITYFNATNSILPDNPDTEYINDLLLRIRYDDLRKSMG